MESASLFVKIFAANMLAGRDRSELMYSMYSTDTLLDRVDCYRVLINEYGVRSTMEHFMRLIVEMKGDAKAKRAMWDELNMAIYKKEMSC